MKLQTQYDLAPTEVRLGRGLGPGPIKVLA